jgi:hypothetical protein
MALQEMKFDKEGKMKTEYPNIKAMDFLSGWIWLLSGSAITVIVAILGITGVIPITPGIGRLQTLYATLVLGILFSALFIFFIIKSVYGSKK